VLGSAKLGWDPAATLAPLGAKVTVTADVEDLLGRLLGELAAGDHVVLMSNGSFEGLPLKLEGALAARAGGAR
jgi:UDP-N-acetylmuramate: L-alanyl-gamma-D-glutamyl-meso-diaminopimelate ligase